MKLLKSFLLILIILIPVVIFILSDSDWYINKTSVLKNKKDIITCTKAEYKSKYSDNQLKIDFNFFNINDKSLKLAENMLKNDEGLINFQLSDKNGDILSEIPIFLKELNYIEAGKYSANKIINTDKNIIRKVKYANFTYKIPICSLAKKESLSDKKTLIVYYSNGGNTKAVANEIKQVLQCDIAEIKSDEIYKQKNIWDLKNLVQKQIQEGYVPKVNKINISDYDVILLGSPVWKSHLSLPAKSFLISHDFKNKTIIPFYTFGGKANKAQIDNEVKEYSHGANVSDSFLTVWNGVAFLEYQIIQWLNEVYL